MAFNSFAISIILRLLAVAGNCWLLAYFNLLNKYLLTQINLAVLLAIQLYLLMRYITRWQKELRLFFDSVKHGDFNIHYNVVNTRDPYNEMYKALNHVSGVVRMLKGQVEQQNQYLKYVVENAQVGLIAYRIDGAVLLCNDEALRIAGLQALKSMNALSSSNPTLAAHMKSLIPGEPRLVVIKHEPAQKLSLRMTRIIVEEKAVDIVSILNIRHELEENELQSWQELISVLTHEIMNSITPIHSLNGSMSKYLDKIDGNHETVEKARNSLAVINRRSQRLMDFVDRYRQISTVPLPEKRLLHVKTLLNDITLLMQDQLRNISVDVEGYDAEILADAGQVEQVFINVIKNAIHAMEGVAGSRLSITIESDTTSVLVKIRDNGPGISEDIASKIFIPFYTTRAQGSGIGLTISRQIMQRHSGRIDFTSETGKGSTFTLRFPKAR